PVGMREHAEEEGLQQAPRQRPRAVPLDVGARGLEQRAERHAGRTRGLAGAAAEAEVEMVRVGIGDVETAFRHRAHQIDAAAGRVHFFAEHAVGGTGREADAAVDARANGVDCSGGGKAGFYCSGVREAGCSALDSRRHRPPTKRPGLRTAWESNSVLIARITASAGGGTGPHGSMRSRRARGPRSMITPPPTSATVARSRSRGARSAVASACVTRARRDPRPAAPATAAPGSSACPAPSVPTRRAGTEPIRSTTPSKPARARSYVFQNEAPIVCTVPCARWTIALTSPS